MKRSMFLVALSVLSASVFGMDDNATLPTQSNDVKMTEISQKPPVKENLINLLTVIKENDLEKVKQIDSIESLVNMQTEDGVFPLFEACGNGYEAIVKYLVDHGADVNQKNNDGKTPLFWACEDGNINVVKFLVESGAKINEEDNNGYTPIFDAVNGARLDVVKYLVDNGADLNVKTNEEGESALLRDAELMLNTEFPDAKEILDYLIKHGAK